MIPTTPTTTGTATFLQFGKKTRARYPSHMPKPACPKIYKCVLKLKFCSSDVVHDTIEIYLEDLQS